ncbi:hypothetical protein [Mycobacterium sp.]|uniref:hypothetical protein n=1 Tax=Mycobacterium sp. TaxID=1785 RepID=UPI0026003A25|nr:hypothetical protein [Mycobacterium sp.]
MPAEDGTAAENVPEPRSSAVSKIAAWWQGRSGLEKILLSIGVVAVGVAGWHFYEQRQDSSREADISTEVKESMQQTFRSDPNFSKYQLTVSKVDVMHKSGNDYEGLATVHSPKPVDHQVAIHVTAEGDKMMWQSDPGAFVWAAMEQFNSAPTGR